MGKTVAIYVKFLLDGAYEKLLKSTNFYRTIKKTEFLFCGTRCKDVTV